MDVQETKIIEIIRNEAAFILFQPIVSLCKRAVLAFEALGRAHLAGTTVGAGRLFRDARKEGLNLELDRLFRKLAVKHYKRLNSPGGPLLSLNFDPRCIDQGIVGSGRFIKLAREYGIPPENIIIEILESRVKDTAALQDFVSRYKEYGFLIAIDDIGTGHSNLDRLFQIQPDIIKIDAGLIGNIHQEYYKQVMVEALTRLAHKTGALVVAEGVETEAELLRAMEAGIDLFQGYYFALPRLPGEFSYGEIFRKIEGVSQLLKTRRLDSLTRRRRQAALYDDLLNHILRAVTACPRGESPACLERICASNKQIDFLYLLDMNGIQQGHTITSRRRDTRNHKLFHPASAGTDHSLREYFLILGAGGKRFISTPYISLASGKFCITLSAVFENADGRQIICADLEVPLRSNA